MKITLKLILLQTTLITGAYAQICENKPLVQMVLKQANIKASESDLIDCKPDPENPSEMIMAYAVWRADYEDAGIGSFRLKILKFTQNGSVVKFIFDDEDELNSDAVALKSIHLDTANYRINKENRVLGVRFRYAVQSSVNPSTFSLLNLYDLKNKQKFLDRFIVSQSQVEMGTGCNAEVKDRKSTLTMKSTQSNQRFDIFVKSEIESYQSYGMIENCVDSKHQISEQRFNLKFDGSQYQIPKAYRSEYLY